MTGPAVASLDPDPPGRIDAVFGSLADPTRRAIVATLARGGDASASALARGLPITRQGVAKHLGILEEAGLVVRRPHGKEIRYRTNPRQIEAAIAWMAQVAAEWDNRLADLVRIASEPDPPEETSP